MPRSRSFWKILFAILVLAAIAYFTGATRVPLWDRDEPWYAECSREMLKTGDWVVPKYLGEWRLEKPPVVYWCQLTVMAVVGDTAAAARFPSTVAILATAVLIAVVVRRYTGDRRALWTTFIFCTSGVAIASAKFCITDGVLLMLVIIGQASLATIYWASRTGRKPPLWTVPAFWISLGLAGLTKGPQPLGEHLFTLVILLCLDVLAEKRGQRAAAWRKHIRWWRQLYPELGLPILVAVVAPWLVLIHHRAPGFILALFQKARMHLEQSMEGHGKPPGYHALLIFGTFFPWSIFLPTTIVLAWKNRRLAVIRFGLAAMAGPWLMMELVYTKLPFYVLPAFPGLSFLTADALIRCIRGQYPDLRKGAFRATVVVWLIATLGLSGAPWLALKLVPADALPIRGLAIFSAAGLLYGALVSVSFFQKRIARAAVIMGVGMAAMLIILYTIVLPGMGILHLPERLAADLRQLGAGGFNTRVFMIGYDEPSLAFYQGGGARRQDELYLQVVPSTDWPRWMVVAQRDWDPLPANLKQKLVVRAQETGLNYSHDGRIERVLIVENPAASS
jgi:4-amino-4-deoxy-L-arabinose transferase-like glycosyltransferase